MPYNIYRISFIGLEFFLQARESYKIYEFYEYLKKYYKYQKKFKIKFIY